MKSLLGLVVLLIILGCGSKADVAGPDVIAESIEYPAGKANGTGFLCRPRTAANSPAIILVHGQYGLTDWVKDQGRRLAGKGYVTLAVDLYRGEVVTDLMDAHIMERGLPEDRVLADLTAAADYLQDTPEVQRDSLGIIGWDMGGGYALDAAIRDARLRAVTVCYGRLTTDPDLLATLRAPVLGIFAGKDEGIPPETIDRFRAAMHKAGKRVAGVEIYPDCESGFLEPAREPSSTPHQNPTPQREREERDGKAIEDAWGRIETFFAAELGHSGR